MIKFKVASAAIAVVAVLALLAGLSTAQQDQNMNSGTSANRNTSQQNSSTSRTNSDAKFMMTAAMGGMAEVRMANLALQKASSDAVRQYAQQMIADHTKAGDELMQLAQSKAVTLPTEADAKHMRLIDKLSQLSGAEFDRMYMREAGVKDHEKMEKLFQREADRGADADVKAFAAKTLPVVQEHLRMARDMVSGMMNTNGNTNGNTNRNMNMNRNMNGNMNGNGNMNQNMNGNTNGNMNSNANDNMTMNENMNGNMNGNMNSNTNQNTNGNSNRNP